MTRRYTRSRRRWMYQLFARARPITRAELDMIRHAVPWQVSLCCAIMADTGLRVSDVLALKREQLAPTMSVCERKTRKTRIVHLSPDTLAECQAYIQTHNSSRIIPCSRSTIWRHVTTAAMAYGWSHVSPHSMRKLYATEYCVAHGIWATQAEMQHEHVETTLLYITDLAAILAQMQRPGTAAPDNGAGSRQNRTNDDDNADTRAGNRP